ncbi:DUF4287 domain-containing protein [Paraglaciecola sp.]|uniref:DUF4287 domain-containing protein n=1 Tax=Paraglaciecola sp. TaxID=1920173 RepID=UPI0032655D9E
MNKTSKTLEQWKTLLTTQSFSKHGEYMSFLKKELNVTHGFANLIILKYRAVDPA